MEYSATAKYLRSSTRKVRLVVDGIRGLLPTVALEQLKVQPKAAASLVADVISSAIANAKQKGINEDKLHFKLIEVMGGPAMKRWQAVSRGRPHSFKKRMTHIRVVLTDANIKEKVN